MASNLGTSANGLTLGVQPHSFNDIDELHNLGLKYATLSNRLHGLPGSMDPGSEGQPKPLWLKFDPHYTAAGDFCQSQTQLPPANRTDPRGCYVLNHNTPEGRSDYNTTAQLVDALIRLARSLGAQTGDSAPLRLAAALCLKSAPSDRCSSPNWLGLTDDTIADAQARIARANLTGALQLALDGDGAPSEPCLYDRWLPLVSTIILSPWEALFTDEPRRLPNGTAPPGYAGYDRFQLLDPNEVEWPIVTALNYGKFGNNTRKESSEYPILLWEPSGQAEIDSESKEYLRTAAAPHLPGLLFASNTDPLMHQLYASRSSGLGWTVAFALWNDTGTAAAGGASSGGERGPNRASSSPLRGGGQPSTTLPAHQESGSGVAAASVYEQEGVSAVGFSPRPGVTPVILSGPGAAGKTEWGVLLLGDGQQADGPPSCAAAAASSLFYANDSAALSSPTPLKVVSAVGGGATLLGGTLLAASSWRNESSAPSANGIGGTVAVATSGAGHPASTNTVWVQLLNYAMNSSKPCGAVFTSAGAALAFQYGELFGNAVPPVGVWAGSTPGTSGVAAVGAPVSGDKGNCGVLLAVQGMDSGAAVTACIASPADVAGLRLLPGEATVSITQIDGAAAHQPPTRAGIVSVPSSRSGVFVVPFSQTDGGGIVLFPTSPQEQSAQLWTAGNQGRHQGIPFPRTPAYVGFRARSAAAALPLPAGGQRAAVLLAIEGSFCPNTEARNKQAVPASCLQVPKAAGPAIVPRPESSPSGIVSTAESTTDGPVVYVWMDPFRIGKELLRDAGVSHRSAVTGVTLSHCGPEQGPGGEGTMAPYYLGGLTLASSGEPSSSQVVAVAVAQLPRDAAVPWLDPGQEQGGASPGPFAVLAHQGWRAGATDSGGCGAPFGTDGAVLEGALLPLLG